MFDAICWMYQSCCFWLYCFIFSHGFMSGQDICIRWVTAAVILSENEICLFLCLISDVLKTQITAYAVFLHKEGDKLSCTNKLLRRHETQFRKALILSSVFSDVLMPLYHKYHYLHYKFILIVIDMRIFSSFLQTDDEH